MVDKGCESCRKWHEHYYWEHIDVTKIRFFKLMTGDFAKGISIPEKFVKNFKGRITKRVYLKAPTGETWHVSVTKSADELLLMSGWEYFVKAHELQENDLLLFTCSGNSSFEVRIFESSGCEKVPSLFGPNMCKHFNAMAARHADHYSLSDSESSDDDSTPSRLVGSPNNASTSKKSSGKTKPRKEPESSNSSSYDVKHEAMEGEESDDRYADSKYYYSRFANWLTDEEKEVILSLSSIRPDNPAFVSVLQKNHVQRRNNTLTIPSRFAADHLEAKAQEIILCRLNKKQKWFVKYYYTRHSRFFQNLQLFKFVSENKLREGDICVFELMKGSRRVMMTVHVIRKVDDRFVLVG
ncbi:B3 domain-containing protein Os12g0592300-like [Phragmites australis]|uniref:B3 domain-containing protein Os12g0592300-like n=1 Tax=Phragmites australis TaxID=29695 RepID=UPI002D790A24|nr:B3 domain-containing protein Os12g0592300-like [Phragmites australis]